MILRHPTNLFTVILTGGIASGKSTAAEYFAELGVPIIDTDIIAREVVQPGTPGLAEVVRLFGNTALTGEGRLDRKRLRGIVFNNDKKRQQLEDVLHPLIEQATIDQLQNLTTQGEPPPYAIIAVPLYTETSRFRWADRLLVIDVAEQKQLERLKSRDNTSSELAEKMLDTQASRDQRLALADDVILNDSTLQALRAACTAMHNTYLAIAAET